MRGRWRGFDFDSDDYHHEDIDLDIDLQHHKDIYLHFDCDDKLDQRQFVYWDKHHDCYTHNYTLSEFFHCPDSLVLQESISICVLYWLRWPNWITGKRGWEFE